MNGKTRVQHILRGQMPDRIPIGFFSIDSDTAEKILGHETYWRAKAKCTIAFWEGRRDEVVQSWIEDGIMLHKKLDIIDIVPVCCSMAGICPPKNYAPLKPRQIDQNTWEDKDGRIYKYSNETQDISIVHDPQTWTNLFKVEDQVWNGNICQPDESIFEVVDALISEFKQDRYILGCCAEEMAWLLLGGMERGFVEIAQRPDEVRTIFMSLVAQANAHDQFYIRPGQDGVFIGTDLSSTTGPMINPETYKSLFFSGYKSRMDNFKHYNQTIFKHACGNNWKLLDIFADLGIDCYQALQTSANMDVVEVLKQYGRRFASWGGVSVENLVSGSQESIRAEVKRMMLEAAPSARFIMGTSHSVAVGTRYDNFMAMLDEFSKYT